MTHVLLVTPWQTGPHVSGDDILTELFTACPPPNISYTSAAAALQAGWLKRSHAVQAWLASLAMHSRPPAGVAYAWPGLPPLPYRLAGRLLPDRPDMDVQWLGTASKQVDLVHAYMHPVHLAGALRDVPLILGNASGNTDLLERYYGLAPAVYGPLVRRDRQLLRFFGVDHDLYNVDRAHAVTVPSRYAWQMHTAAGVPAAKLRLIRLGMAIAPPTARPDAETCRFTLVGNGFWRKGGRELLAAFRRLHAAHPQARLTIVSQLDPAELGPDAAGIEVLPGLSRQEVFARIYPATDVYVLPSLAEGYGLSVVEAMGHGLPVIASQLGALPELVRDEETGLLVQPGDADDLFEAMQALLLDPARRLALGTAGRALFEAEHAVEVTNQALAALYAEALG